MSASTALKFNRFQYELPVPFLGCRCPEEYQEKSFKSCVEEQPSTLMVLIEKPKMLPYSNIPHHNYLLLCLLSGI